MGIIAGAIFSIGILDFCARILMASRKYDRAYYGYDEDSEDDNSPIIMYEDLWKAIRASKRKKKKRK